MDKILWVDTETTGLGHWKNGIIQMSGFIEIDGEDVEEFDFQVKPFPQDEINNAALKVNGVTREQLNSFPNPTIVYEQLLAVLDRHVDKYDKSDKYIIAGYNINFDKRFLESFFKKNGNPYFFSYIDSQVLDVLAAVQLYKMRKRPDIPNAKLVTIAKHFGFDANFHNSMDDIRVTREVYLRVMKEVGD